MTYNLKCDARWRRGCHYAASYQPAQSPAVRAHCAAIIAPPEITQAKLNANNHYKFDPVPGMIKMPPGVPFVNFISGESSRPVTIACLHTINSLAEYMEGPNIYKIVEELKGWTWGRRPGGELPACRPIYTLEGLNPNSRSGAKVDSRPYDGSYNLASTILQGNGQGITQPAVQTTTEEAIVSISNINQLLARLYRLIIPLTVSKEEMEVTDFNAIDNNIFSIGGIDPNNTSIQLNVSSITNSDDSLEARGSNLAASLGEDTGSWHFDAGDDPVRWTLFTLLFRLPPGKCVFV
jgi:hypothetical protein